MDDRSQRWTHLHGLGDGPSAWDALAWPGDRRDLATELANGRGFKGIIAPIEPVSVIAHSMGVLVALSWAKLGMVQRLVCIEGSVRPQDANAVRRYCSESLDGSGWARLVDDLQKDPGPPAFYGANLRRWSPAVFDAAAAETVATQPSGADLFRSLDIPKLYIVGANSAGESAKDFADRNTTVAAVPNAGHWPHVDAPGYVRQLIENWAIR